MKLYPILPSSLTKTKIHILCSFLELKIFENFFQDLIPKDYSYPIQAISFKACHNDFSKLLFIIVSK